MASGDDRQFYEVVLSAASILKLSVMPTSPAVELQIKNVSVDLGMGSAGCVV